MVASQSPKLMVLVRVQFGVQQVNSELCQASEFLKLAAKWINCLQINYQQSFINYKLKYVKKWKRNNKHGRI